LFAYMGGIIRAMHGIALIVNGTENHVHLLVRMPTVCSVSEMVRVLKVNSSRWAHEKMASAWDVCVADGIRGFQRK
jgi:REP element-mobilizing transposase RayT